jgi:hypothetical protein
VTGYWAVDHFQKCSLGAQATIRDGEPPTWLNLLIQVVAL